MSARRFDLEAVLKPLSERGHVPYASGSSLETPPEQAERGTRRLALDLSEARSDVQAFTVTARKRARKLAVLVAAFAALAVVGLVTVVMRARRERIADS